MKLYSAIVYVGRTPYVFQFHLYQNKAEFVADLRKRGFKVNPLMVKPSKLFCYIIGHPEYNHDMWKLRSIPKKEVQ
jgi:hypothetical protein